MLRRVSAVFGVEAEVVCPKEAKMIEDCVCMGSVGEIIAEIVDTSVVF